LKCPSCHAECPEQAEACFTCGQALFALSQGTLLAGRYEIVRPVGRGGMSRVYQAHDRVLGEAVAIKVLRAELAWEPEMRQRFLHEIRLARRVSHPNVCRIHEYGEDGPRRYISMELVEGVNLKDVLRHRGLSTEEAFDLVLQMVDGLAAVHQHGIVHRDFKASNIMIASSGVAKLMDFGIAKHAEADTGNFTTPGQVLGTPEYMSPEHARGGQVDFRSDIYALGCVVFEMFTGQAPFRGPNAFATIAKHFHEAPPLEGPLATLIPEALVPVLRKALAKEAAQRYASVPEARDALRQAQAQSVAPSLEEPADPNAAGSPRLRRLCEALLAKGAGTASLEPPDDSAAQDATPSLSRLAIAQREQAAAPAPAADGGAVRRVRPAYLAATAGLLAAAAASMLLWPDSRAAAPPRAGGDAPAATTPREAPAPPTVQPASASVPAAAPPAAATTPTGAPPRPRVTAGRPRGESVPPLSLPAPSASTAAGAPPTGAARGSVRPRPAAAPTGTLRLLVVPWAEVIVDGTSLGTVQLRDLPLEPGVHTVRVLHPDYHPLQRKVTIQAGAMVRLVLDLSEKGIRKVP
jgi:serine/threonine-protein kinase